MVLSVVTTFYPSEEKCVNNLRCLTEYRIIAVDRSDELSLRTAPVNQAESVNKAAEVGEKTAIK